MPRCVCWHSRRSNRHGLIRNASRALARRVKALAADPALKARALDLLAAHGIDARPWSSPTSSLSRPRLLSFSTFRRKVNPLFYQAGEDKQACANCHGNHTILRIAEADAAGGFSGEQLMINYNSALKVVNLGEPEASLILRKPRSPQGQGGSNRRAPRACRTSAARGGKVRNIPPIERSWNWIREASSSAAAQAGAEKLSADSYAPGYEPARAGDGDLAHDLAHRVCRCDARDTRMSWSSISAPRASRGPPLRSPSGQPQRPRQGLRDPGLRRWQDLERAPRQGTMEQRPSFKHVALPGSAARYVQLRGLSEVEGRPFMSAAELSVDTSNPPGTTAH